MPKQVLVATLILALLITLILVASFPPLTVSSEVQSVQWNKTYGEPDIPDYAYSVVQSIDGGYLIAGGRREQGGQEIHKVCWLVKTDENGNMQWNKTLGGESIWGATDVIKTTDGGYALAGDQVSSGNLPVFWLVKIDAVGEMQWNRTYEDESAGEQCIIQTIDGGFAIVNDGLLVKLDSIGSIQWSRNYSGVRNVVETQDRGFAMSGITYAGDSYHIWLAKSDSSGNMQCNKTYESWGTKEVANSLVQTSDGGFAVAGEIRFPTTVWSDILFFKTDSAGNLQWGKTWGGSTADWAISMAQATDGGYALACSTSHADFVLLRIDSEGNQLWSKKYVGYSGPNYAQCVIQTSDGGYALAGYGHPPIVNAPEDFWLVKTDSAGNNPNASDISVPITGSFPFANTSPSPNSSSSPEQSPLPSVSPTQKPKGSLSPTPTITSQPVSGFFSTNLLLVVTITTVALVVVSAGLLVYFKKHKPATELVKKP